MTEQVPIEPSASMRAGAQQIRALYVAYMEAGFSAEEALRMILATLGKK